MGKVDVPRTVISGRILLPAAVAVPALFCPRTMIQFHHHAGRSGSSPRIGGLPFFVLSLLGLIELVLGDEAGAYGSGCLEACDGNRVVHVVGRGRMGKEGKGEGGRRKEEGGRRKQEAVNLSTVWRCPSIVPTCILSQITVRSCSHPLLSVASLTSQPCPQQRKPSSRKTLPKRRVPRKSSSSRSNVALHAPRIHRRNTSTPRTSTPSTRSTSSSPNIPAKPKPYVNHSWRQKCTSPKPASRANPRRRPCWIYVRRGWSWSST